LNSAAEKLGFAVQQTQECRRTTTTDDRRFRGDVLFTVGSCLGIEAIKVFYVSENEKLFTDGEAYERRMGRWSRMVGEAFLEWLAIPKGLRWLDVGCGNHAFTEVLIARCGPAAVSAIDPSEGMLNYARMRPGAKLAEFRGR
jgi:2-polyprenyl-3-methyl-5-hydroxy-6-metoxy-1,4-benzoquinol methylase